MIRIFIWSSETKLDINCAYMQNLYDHLESLGMRYIYIYRERNTQRNKDTMLRARFMRPTFPLNELYYDKLKRPLHKDSKALVT